MSGAHVAFGPRNASNIHAMMIRKSKVECLVVSQREEQHADLTAHMADTSSYPSCAQDWKRG